MKKSHCLRALAAALLALVFAGCSAADGEGPVSAGGGASEDRPAGVDRERLLAMFSGASYRYPVVDNPVELASLDVVELALSGEVVGYEVGIVPENRESNYVVMTVTPTDVFDGRRSAPVDVLLSAPGHATPEDFAAALPPGSPTVLYLGESKIPDWWLPVTPQGFIVEDDQGVIFPMAPELSNDETLAEQVPGVEMP